MIFNLIFVAIVVVLCVEIANLVPFGNSLSTLSSSVHKTGAVLSSKNISDHWKERALRSYAQTLFVGSLRLLFLMLLIFSPILLLMVVDWFFGYHLVDRFLTTLGLVWSLLVGIGYGYFRFRKVSG